MPTLFLICGLPGSGKTTLAKNIEREQRALRLCPDEWITQMIGDGDDEVKRAAVEAVQWKVAARALTLGVNVVLENGFWSRQERDDFKSRARRLGADAKLYFLDVDREELLRRLGLRNADLPPNTFRVGEALLDSCICSFEPPTPDELE